MKMAEATVGIGFKSFMLWKNKLDIMLKQLLSTQSNLLIKYFFTLTWVMF